MSYIRCLSNPERLYIFGDGLGLDRITVIVCPKSKLTHSRTKEKRKST